MKHNHSIGHTARTALATTALALFGVLGSARAQFEITTATGSTAQNFDALAGSGTNNLWTNDTTLVPGDSTLEGWSLFTYLNGAISAYDAGSGAGNTGKFYSFGAGTAPERALGGVGSGGGNTNYFGLPQPASGAVAGYIAFGATNNSASTLSALTVGFDGEQWRNGGNATPQSMVLEYGIGATFATVPAWTAPGASFNWTSPIATATAAAVDGNVAGLQAGRGGILSGVTLSVGDTLWIRWVENNDAGNDHGLAIDNFSLAWTPSTTIPKNLIWTPTTNVWDTAATNWKDIATSNIVSFNNNDTVTFDDTGITMNTVAVAAGGVGPAGVTVNNTTGVYTISGGPINSGSALVKDGAGTLVLGSAYSQGLNVLAGTVRTAANQVIGDSSTVTLANGTTLDLNGNNETVGALNLTGATITSGAGLLTVGGAVTTVVSPTDTPVTISGNVSNGGVQRIWVVSDSLAPEDLILNANFTGAGRVNFDGAGTVRLGGDNSAFTGGFQLDSGITYVLGSGKALGTGQAFLNGGTLQAAVPLTGADKLSTAMSLGGNGVAITGNNIDFGGALTFFGLGVKTYTVDTGLTLTLSNTLTGTNTSAINTAITKAGPGTIVFGADGSAYTGVVTLSAGAAIVSSANGLGTGPVTLNASAPDTVTLTATTSTAIGALFSSGDGTNSTVLGTGAANTTPVVLTINTATDATYSGRIETAVGHVGGVVKAGTGIESLTGPQSYATLRVEGGKLVLGGALTTPGGAAITVLPASGTAELEITAGETIASLNIGAGGVVTLSAPPPPAPEFFGGAEASGAAPALPVPEPGTAALLAGGIALMLGRRRQ